MDDSMDSNPLALPTTKNRIVRLDASVTELNPDTRLVRVAFFYILRVAFGLWIVLQRIAFFVQLENALELNRLALKCDELL